MKAVNHSVSTVVEEFFILFSKEDMQEAAKRIKTWGLQDEDQRGDQTHFWKRSGAAPSSAQRMHIWKSNKKMYWFLKGTKLRLVLQRMDHYSCWTDWENCKRECSYSGRSTVSRTVTAAVWLPLQTLQHRCYKKSCRNHTRCVASECQDEPKRNRHCAGRVQRSQHGTIVLTLDTVSEIGTAVYLVNSWPALWNAVYDGLPMTLPLS